MCSSDLHARLAVEPVVEADPQRVSYSLLGKLEKIIISGKCNANIDRVVAS